MYGLTCTDNQRIASLYRRDDLVLDMMRSIAAVTVDIPKVTQAIAVVETGQDLYSWVHEMCGML
jgi:hypothetical protein